MSKKFVKLYDTVQINPISIERLGKNLSDSYLSDTGQSLRVSIVATHSGRITRNHGFYLPQKMRDGAASLLEPYHKPILLHHNEQEDPIGRIVSARYVDTSGTIVTDSKQETLLRRICDSKTPFFHLIDLVDELTSSELLSDPLYPGLGHIVVDADITDNEAIKKIMDKRYLTVSIGATTDRAMCSVCKSDWVEDGKCNHVPGKKYEDKLCVMVAGGLIYEEVSFVNAPADTLARVVSVGNTTGVIDSVVVIEAKKVEVNASFSFQDAIDTISVGGNNMEKLKEAWELALKVASDESVKQDERSAALAKFLEDNKDAKENPYKEEAEAMLAKLTEDKSDSKDVEDKSSSKETTEQVIDEKTQSNDKDQKDDVKTEPEADVKDGKDKIEEDLVEANEHYEDMIEFGFALSLFDDTQDAKLTPEKRKSLKKGTFCKPGERKYPVPDCSHARVAMAYAKKNNEATSVLACIRRKAKALGCPFGGGDCFEAEIDEILEDLRQREIGEKANDTVEDKTEPKPEVKDEHKCESCENLKEQLKALRQELRDIYNEASEDEQLFTDALNNTRHALADALARLGVIANKELKDFDQSVKNISSMKIEDLLKKTQEIKESIDLEAVVGKLDDGMSRKPTDSVENPTNGASVEQDPTTIKEDQEEEKFSRIRNAYSKKFERDPGEADAYLRKLKQEGIIPFDFDPNATKEESV